MSFLVGTLSGGLVAGGVYYGFSNMIQTRTQQHCTDLLKLSNRLVKAQSTVPAPPTAAERVTNHPFASMLKSQWNTQIETLFQTAGDWDRQITNWGRQVLYGGEALPAKKE